MSKFIVSKFGGSSMKDREAMLRSANIIKKHNSHLVIVSATYGTTNQLVEISNTAPSAEWKNCRKIVTKIRERHLKLAQDLEVPNQAIEDIELILNELKTLAKGINLLKDCSPKAYDSLLAIGERLSSRLFTECLAQVWNDKKVSCLDVREVMITDQNFNVARPLKDELKKQCQTRLVEAKHGHHAYVTQGFIGSSENGLTTTLGRGGSDYSAALLAWGAEADVLQIWTDVAGIASTDPRICTEATPISEITFSEASELANFGAKILHPATLAPAAEVNIPVFVGSSYEPDSTGTWISEETKSKPLIRAMAMRKDQTLLTLKNPKMLQTYGFLFSIFKVFNDHKMSVDSITTSEISVAMTINGQMNQNISNEFLKDLAELGDLKVEEDLSLISLIGNKINHTPGLAANIFNSIPEINVRMICLGASKHNFCFLVNNSDAQEAIQLLHKTFIGKE
jgi:aspartate kinase